MTGEPVARARAMQLACPSLFQRRDLDIGRNDSALLNGGHYERHVHARVVVLTCSMRQ